MRNFCRLPITFLLVLSGCPRSKPDQLQVNLQNVEQDPNIAWLGLNPQTNFKGLAILEQGMLYNILSENCADVMDNDGKWKSLIDELGDVHSALIRRDTQNIKTGITAEKWIGRPISTPGWKIAYYQNGFNANLGIGLDFSTLVSANIGVGGSTNSVDLFFGKVSYQVNLSTRAKKCITSSLCSRLMSEHDEKVVARFFTSAIYGTSLAVTLSGATVNSKIKASVGYGQFKGNLLFTVDKKNIAVRAAVLGATKTIPTGVDTSKWLKDNLYDIPEMLDDLSSGKTVTVATKWQGNTTEDALIALEYEVLTKKQCESGGK